jgi:hypothetical protein
VIDSYVASSPDFRLCKVDRIDLLLIGDVLPSLPALVGSSFAACIERAPVDSLHMSVRLA